MIRFPNKNRELSHCLESLVSTHFKYLFYEKDKFNSTLVNRNELNGDKK